MFIADQMAADLDGDWLWFACENSWACNDWRDDDDLHALLLFGA